MLAKTDADAVRVHNRLAVIDCLRRAEKATRKELSAATGLSVSAASAIATGLLRSGLVVETVDCEESPGGGAGEMAARRGRPGRSLALNGAVARIAVAKIAVGEIAVRVCDYRGNVMGTSRWDGDIGDFSQVDIVGHLGRLLDEAEAAAAEAASPSGAEARGAPAIRRIVVAVQGKTDSAGTRIVWSPALRHRDLKIAGPLAALRGASVGVFNDCSLLPEAFRWTPDFQGRDFAILFIGFGVGMGLRLGGLTFQGQRSSAVEFGHINHIPGGALCRCGNRGCIEAYAADYAIWRRANGRADDIPARRVTDAEIVRLAGLARAGDGAATQAFEEAGAAIGYGLGRLFTLVDPLPVVITGAGAHAIDLLEPAIRGGISQSAIDAEGADVAFSHSDDVDELIFKAATARALGALDDGFARNDRSAELGMAKDPSNVEEEKAA